MQSVASAGRAAATGRSRRAGTGRHAVRRRSRCGGGRRCGIRLGRRTAATCGSRCTTGTAAEVRHVPTRSLELEACSGELLLERRRAACGAIRQRSVAHLLQHIFGVAAGVASISIDRHGVLTQKQTNDKKAIGLPAHTRDAMRELRTRTGLREIGATARHTSAGAQSLEL